ncbi:unnamed protein product [Mycena citricolor]|uniref:Metal-dependent protein hydrolase n=1 Tax=Mycena citricolor TaxID=2018698 RepID=A0AAD2K5W6_9AGAR|nr:unnamed protein product [Mycena citricolor]
MWPALFSRVRSFPFRPPRLSIGSRKMASSVDVPQAKKQKTSKVIGTHNGTFHCDEALAVFLLRHTAVYRDAEVKRSRDPAVLETCDIVVDVGAVYDESKNLFDHHQRGFSEVFGHGFETKLSSAGLVYKHFGQEIIANQTGLAVDDNKVTTLWLKMYRVPIHRSDRRCGQRYCTVSFRSQAQIPEQHRLSSRVASLNPVWNQPSSPSILDVSPIFESVGVDGTRVSRKLNFYANAWLPARDLLIAAIAASKVTEPSGKIIVFEQFLPWKEHLFDFEAESQTPESEKAIYIVYPDDGESWRVQAVPIASESFESRKALPDPWRGLRDEKLSAATGIDGCIFVHASGFIGGNKTKEGALKLAKAALMM